MLRNLTIASGLASAAAAQRAGRGSLFHILNVWIERSRQRRALAALDDRMLADIGLTRSDAAREVANPFWR